MQSQSVVPSRTAETNLHRTADQEAEETVRRVSYGLLTVAAICVFGMLTFVAIQDWGAVVTAASVAVLCAFTGCLGLTQGLKS